MLNIIIVISSFNCHQTNSHWRHMLENIRCNYAFVFGTLFSTKSAYFSNQLLNVSLHILFNCIDIFRISFLRCDSRYIWFIVWVNITPELNGFHGYSPSRTSGFHGYTFFDCIIDAHTCFVSVGVCIFVKYYQSINFWWIVFYHLTYYKRFCV